MDNNNTKDLFDPDNNDNNQSNIGVEFDPSIGSGVPDTDAGDLPDDLNMKNDEDLFGEPIEEQEQEREQEGLPQALEDGVRKEGEMLSQQSQELKNDELPTAETGSKDENRIKNDQNNSEEENKPIEYNANETDLKAESEEIVSGEKDASDNAEINVGKDEKENEKGDNDDSDGSNINNNNNTNNNSNNINDNPASNPDTISNNDGNIYGHGYDNEINENKEKSEEKPPVGIEEQNEEKGFQRPLEGQQQQQQKPEAKEEAPRPNTESKPSAAAVSTTMRPEPETTTMQTTKTAKMEDNDLAVPQSHEIVIPSYARWFNLTKIHPIEKQSLPEFFTNRIPSKTPQVYVKCRNFMVNSYRLNPNEYFSVTTARRNVCGDAAAVFRIHKFLMKWGLINYQVDAQLLPKSVEPPFTGEYSTRHDAPRGLFPFESYKPSVQLPDMAKLKKMMDTDDNSSTLHKYLNDERRRSQTLPSEDSPEIKHEDKERGDDNTNQDESIENPHGAKRPKIIKSSTEIDDGWQKDEVERLLKGIQTHGSDWYKIAKDVGNKTPEQCVLKFIQMPIEDRFLHQDDENGSDIGSLKYAPHLPFSKSENPVMSTLAFLIGLVHPKVVQGMTDRALQKLELQQEDKDQSLSPSQPEPESQSQPSAATAPPPTVKEASGLAVSSLGVRSHVFANNEERQMSSIAHQMAQIQLQKVDIKLKLLDKVEKSLELEKKTLQRQQEDVLVQRISFAKHSKNVSKKLEESLTCFEDKEKLAAHIEEIKNLVSHPPKVSIGSAFTNSGTAAESDGSTNKQEGEIEPVSVEAPQSYRYWSA